MEKQFRLTNRTLLLNQMYNRHIIFTSILVFLAFGCSKTDMKTKLQGDWVGKTPGGSDITISFEDSIIAGFPWWLDDARFWVKEDTLYLKFLTMHRWQYQDTIHKLWILKADRDSLIFINIESKLPMSYGIYKFSRSKTKYDSTINIQKVCFLSGRSFDSPWKYIEMSNTGEYLSMDNNGTFKGRINDNIFNYLQNKIRASDFGSPEFNSEVQHLRK